MTSVPSEMAEPPPTLDFRHGGLNDRERAWRDRQPWLQERGYMLRPRYRPDWKPSWLGTDKSFIGCEDGLTILSGNILDATRISDGTLVMLKQVNSRVHPHEVEITRFLSSEPVASDPRNHCMRLVDVLPDPSEQDVSIIAVALFKQLIEGLQFIHAQHVAHRDITILNVMMDASAMYPNMWHPQMPIFNRDYYSGSVKHYSRTERPPKYYYIDFGLSRKYNPEDGPPRELPIRGGDKSVPEFQGEGYDKPWDPFRTDIYYLGSLIREAFLEKYRNVDFMRPLVDDMVQDNPDKRPTIDEVASRSELLFGQLSSWKLRARLVEREETAFTRTTRNISHLFHTARHIVRRLPAVPLPSK
ncbi:uncharacterized protein B0H18DRAFT_1122090 [Fomitopsis serialis]|uniref:uncharacterized protein n=1 Tax=Fomitopsis serialis TaxID=139415 RepID=UPI0020076274|nr:uncharacterized protein B0H18DRAFT_1122090 [Neoantrodia serialis]KAH9920123.1 hypothetical protein B0H18DRAFT_1122090 [Neoantrodia serialis]